MSESPDAIKARIVDFITQIGLDVRTEAIQEETVLPGIAVHHGILVVDYERWLYPGDLLHEAGHLAVMEPERRRRCHIESAMMALRK